LTIYGESNGFGGVKNTRVGIGTSSPASTLTVVGSLCVHATGTCGTASGTIYATNAVVQDIDLAENYTAADPNITAGDIVALDTSATSTNGVIRLAEYGDQLFGVISTKPGLLLGQAIPDSKPVALKGRVPLKVNMDGGPIEIGDAITISTEPGVGMKATTTVQTIGIALEATSTPGQIEVFVQTETHFSQEDQRALNIYLALASALSSTTDSSVLESPESETFFNNVFNRLVTWFANATNGIGDFFANRVRTEELCVGEENNETCITKTQLDALLSNSANSGGGTTPPPEEPPAETASTTEPTGTTTPPVEVEEPEPEPEPVAPPPTLPAETEPEAEPESDPETPAESELPAITP
jgi:hypothetical protein